MVCLITFENWTKKCPKSQIFVYQVFGIQIFTVYSGDLNTGLVWYSNGLKLSDRRMVRYSNAI